MKLSAKDFHGPLLRSLGRLSGWEAERHVAFKSTFDPIMAIMGIASLEEHGFNDSAQQPNVVKWVQWAQKNLKAQGMTAAPARGQWALTKKGLEEARRVNQLADPIPTLEPQGEREQAQFEEGYHNDPYLVFLGARSTKCYSHFSGRSPVCKSCPLSAKCQDARWASLSALARTLG